MNIKPKYNLYTKATHFFYKSDKYSCATYGLDNTVNILVEPKIKLFTRILASLSINKLKCLLITYKKGVDEGGSKEGLESVLHQHSCPVHQGPVLQVVVAAVPETHEAKRQASGQGLVCGAVA